MAQSNSVRNANRPPRKLSLRIHSVARWLHTTISMLSLVVILFFSVTGMTLNHTEWVGGAVKEHIVNGAIPVAWLTVSADKKLEVVEKLRSEYGARGTVEDFRMDATECTVSFKAAGYSADAFIATASGALEMRVAEESLLAVLNDFHRGQRSGLLWTRIIDISAIFLTVVSCTGLTLIFFLKRTRAAGLIAAAVGAIVMAVVAASSRM